MSRLPLLNDHRPAKPNAVLKVIVLLFVVSIGLSACQKGSESEQHKASPPTDAAGLPRLVDLGAGKCIPCKMMAPILEELKTEYAGSMEVVFIDVWQDKDAGQKYGIQSIPTQIFYDASGKELFRHEGFFAKEEILAKWKELGITLQPKKPAQPGET